MSHEKFEVGEIALAAGWTTFPEWEGKEVEIVKPLGCEVINAVARYGARGPDGRTYLPRPDQLRKRRPPPQDWVKLCPLNEVPNAIEVARKALA